MPLTVKVRADSKFPIDRKRLRAVLRSAWRKFGFDGDATVSVAVVGTRKMAELHQRYLGKKGATDVLAFPQHGSGGDEYGFVTPGEAELQLGDIVLCYPLIVDQAVEGDILIDDRVEELALHGLEHLLGAEE